MQINSITNAGAVIRQPESAAPARVPKKAGDQAEFAGAEALNSALESAPEVRSEEVARGEAVASSVQYPPVEMIRRISRLLANNWISPGE